MSAPVPNEHTWVCEGCSYVYETPDPPEECAWCGHEYFSNYADLLEERNRGEVH